MKICLVRELGLGRWRRCRACRGPRGLTRPGRGGHTAHRAPRTGVREVLRTEVCSVLPRENLSKIDIESFRPRVREKIE